MAVRRAKATATTSEPRQANPAGEGAPRSQQQPTTQPGHVPCRSLRLLCCSDLPY